MSPIILDPLAEDGRTFLELQNEALHDDFDQTKYRAAAKRFLNEAQRRVARRVRVPELEDTLQVDTVAGEATVELPYDVVRINSLRNTADRAPLEAVPVDDVDLSPASTGSPSVYASVGRRLILGPTPGGAYPLEVRVQGRPVELVDDGDVPQLGDDYADLLVTYARARLFRLEDDFDAAREYMGEFERDLGIYAGDVMLKDRSRIRQVGDRLLRRRVFPRVSRP